jgi:DNA-binding MarR family transcriptional regulator
MDIHQTTASNLVKAMATAGLVVANRGSRPPCTQCLRVTPAGARVLKKAPGPFSGVLPEALAALDARTLARLDDDLGKLLDKLKTDARAPASRWPRCSVARPARGRPRKRQGL